MDLETTKDTNTSPSLDTAVSPGVSPSRLFSLEILGPFPIHLVRVHLSDAGLSRCSFLLLLNHNGDNMCIKRTVERVQSNGYELPSLTVYGMAVQQLGSENLSTPRVSRFSLNSPNFHKCFQWRHSSFSP